MKQVKNRVVVEVISTRDHLSMARYGAGFLVNELNLSKNRQITQFITWFK